MKHITKIILAILCITISFSTLGCTGLDVEMVSQQVINIQTFANNVTALTSSLQDASVTGEKRIELANKLFHKDSGLSIEKIIEDITNDEELNKKLGGIETVTTISLANMPDMNDLANLMKYDAEKDAMVYHAEIDVLINGQVFTVGIDLLSDENGMGIYAYSFK